MFQRLLEPLQIRRVTFRNRIIKPGQCTRFTDKDGNVTDRIKGHYEALAKGGVGMLVVESSAIDFPLGMSAVSRLIIADDRYIAGFSELVKIIHSHGCPAFLQLQHGGPAMPGKVYGLQPVAASSLSGSENPKPAYGLARELAVSEIKGIVEKYAKAGERARKSGFDGVELHAAHSYLLNTFLSGAWNKRRDEYGGPDLRNRARFPAEIIQAIKAQLGQDFPVGIRINGAEYGIKNGLTSRETQGIARIFEEAGVDYIHVSVYGFTPFDWVIQPEQVLYPELSREAKPLAKGIKTGALVPLAAAIKKRVSIPVITVGRLDPVLGERILEKGEADLIAMGRQLLADPELPNKVAAGRLDDIRPCTACLTCLSREHDGKPLACRINPALGREREYVLKPAGKKKTVMVVGGGPAGMQAAIVAARRGHDVTLYERDHNLGGLLPMAAFIKGLEIEDLPALVRYLRHQIDKLGVKVRLGTEVDPALVARVKPDVVILATGGVPTVPDIPGIDRAIVITSSHLRGQANVFLRFLGPGLLRRLTKIWMPIRGRVVIIGGLIHGCETAEFLIKRGRKVTIVEKSNQLGTGIPSVYCERLIPWLKKKGVTMVQEARYEEVTDKGLVVTTKEGKRQTLEADTVLVAVPPVTNSGLFETLQGQVPELYLIGDGKEPRLIVDAIDEGWRVGGAI